MCSDPTLTMRNLLTVLEMVKHWRSLELWLDIPEIKWDMITDKVSMLREWLDNHPAPSWELLAWALYRRGDGKLNEHNVVKQLYGRYVTGMSVSVS